MSRRKKGSGRDFFPSLNFTLVRRFHRIPCRNWVAAPRPRTKVAAAVSGWRCDKVAAVDSASPPLSSSTSSSFCRRRCRRYQTRSSGRPGGPPACEHCAPDDCRGDNDFDHDAGRRSSTDMLIAIVSAARKT